MHERSVIVDLVRQAADIVERSGSPGAVAVGVRLGALSHLSAPHLQSQFAAEAKGTVLEGARLDITVDDDPTADAALDALITHVEVIDPEGDRPGPWDPEPRVRDAVEPRPEPTVR